MAAMPPAFRGGPQTQPMPPTGPGMTPGAGGPPGAPTAAGLAGAGANQLFNTLNGQYLDPNSNPWLARTANEATQGLVNQYRNATSPGLMAQQVAGGGGPGSLNASGFQQQQQQNQYDLGENIGNVEAQIYGGAYNQERNRQMQGEGLLGSTMESQYMPAHELLGVGSLEQQQQQNDFNTMYQNAQASNQYPMDMLSRFGSIFGQATGGSGQQVSIGSSSK